MLKKRFANWHCVGTAKDCDLSSSLWDQPSLYPSALRTLTGALPHAAQLIAPLGPPATTHHEASSPTQIQFQDVVPASKSTAKQSHPSAKNPMQLWNATPPTPCQGSAMGAKRVSTSCPHVACTISLKYPANFAPADFSHGTAPHLEECRPPRGAPTPQNHG